MTYVVSLLKSINATMLNIGGGGTDIAKWIDAGVPGGSLANDNGRYFYWHHTDGIYIYIKYTKF